jgi:hypothetical protein
MMNLYKDDAKAEGDLCVAKSPPSTGAALHGPLAGGNCGLPLQCNSGPARGLPISDAQDTALFALVD